LNSSAERLTQDVKVLATDLQELVKATASETGEKICAARARVESSLLHARDKVTVQARQAARTTDRYVHEHALETAGLAALAGAVVGFLIGRR
jgi:ElaB/YqjD/DUF883 family membrane-anchored ribosome-binding protein